VLGGSALKNGLFVAFGVLLLGAIWLVLTASGELGRWGQGLAGRMPSSLMLTVALVIPVLAALCSLHLRIDWRLRIALFLVLLTCVPLLPIAFNSHPVVVVAVVVIFVVEELGIIPLINSRWLPRD
jgi:cytochrome bd-type quinol oxidase subunit 2